jgi:hypothetical protein
MLDERYPDAVKVRLGYGQSEHPQHCLAL